MLEVKFKKKTYSFPNAWEELTPKQFIYLVSLLMAFSKDQMSPDQVRTLFFLEVAGLKPRRFRNQEKEDLFSENVYRISRQLNFMFRIHYQNEKSFAVLPAKIRELLIRNLPEELDDTSADMRAARKLKKKVVIDGVFASNLVPEIKARRSKLSGYYFDLTGDLLSSDLQADQFIDASAAFDLYLNTREPVFLDLLVATLYPDGLYKSSQISKNTSRVTGIPLATKLAVFFNFQAVQLFLQEGTDYSVLWWKSAGQSKKKEKGLGLGDSLYSLSKAGYGDIKALKKMSLIEMFNLMVKELRDAVHSLQDMEKSPTEIVEATKLSLDQVTFLMR